MERKLTDIVAEHIIKRKQALLEEIGLDDRQVEAAMEETLKTYEQYVQCFKLREEGMSYRQIGMQLCMDRSQVYYWEKRGKIPRPFSTLSFFSDSDFKTDSIDDLVSVMALCASKKFSNKDKMISVSSSNREELEPFRPPLFSVLSVIPSIEYAYGWWNVTAGAAKFLDFYFKLTNGNSKLPWKYLKSDRLKKHFFKNYFARRGSVALCYPDARSYGIITFHMQNKSLREDFMILLYEMGMVPRIRDKIVEISDMIDFQTILDEKLCISQRKLTKLQDVVNKTKITQDPKVRIRRRKKLVEKYKSMRYTNEWKAQRYIISQLGGTKQFSKIVAQNLSYKRITNFHDLHDLQMFISRQVVPDSDYESDAHLHADIVAWKKYILGQNNSSKDTCIILDDLFNMFVPDEAFESEESLRAYHLDYYQHLRESPRFLDYVKIDGNEFHVNDRKLVERILGKYVGNVQLRDLRIAQKLSCV